MVAGVQNKAKVVKCSIQSPAPSLVWSLSPASFQKPIQSPLKVEELLVNFSRNTGGETTKKKGFAQLLRKIGDIKEMFG